VTRRNGIYNLTNRLGQCDLRSGSPAKSRHRVFGRNDKRYYQHTEKDRAQELVHLAAGEDQNAAYTHDPDDRHSVSNRAGYGVAWRKSSRFSCPESQHIF
jgi:hypothetical protein